MTSFPRITLVLLVLVGLLTACPGVTPPPLPEGAVVIPDTTKVSDAATRNALTSFDGDSGVMRFSELSDVLASVELGDVIVSEPSEAAPHGYLRKVTAIRREGDGVIVETELASLTEAVYRGELEFTREMQPEDLVEPQVFVQGLTIAPAVDPQAAGFNFVAYFDETVLDISEGGVSSTVRVSGSLSFNVGFNFGLAIDGDFFPPDIYVTRFEASANVGQRAELHVSGDAKAEFTRDVEVARVPFGSFCVPIGPVPICFSPTMYMFVGASGKVNLQFDYGVVQTFDAGIGARYRRGRGWENIGYGPDLATAMASDPSIDGGMRASAYGRAEIGLMLFGVAGPTFGAKLGVELDAAAQRDPFWRLDGFLEAYYGLVVDLPIFGRFADHRATIFDLRQEVTRSPNAPPNIELRQQSARIDHGFPSGLTDACNFAFCIWDREDGVPDFTLTSDKDGLLPEGQYIFPSKGKRTITIRATDSKGATANASITVEVVDAPPNLTIAGYSGTAYPSTPYFLTALVTDINEPHDGGLCANTTWEVSAPDTLSATKGCQVEITWGDFGTRSFKVTARDGTGMSTTVTRSVTVKPDLENPLPYWRVDGFKLESRQLEWVSGKFGGLFCRSVQVVAGRGIDLKDSGCLGDISTRYSASVEVWRMPGMSETYDWRVYVTSLEPTKHTLTWVPLWELLETTDDEIDLYTIGNAEETGPCYVEVSSGATTTVVWTGTCSYLMGPVIK